jgi:hypothetical protein
LCIILKTLKIVPKVWKVCVNSLSSSGVLHRVATVFADMFAAGHAGGVS